jgi:ParB/RepB/Spo0J family partition protein
LQEHPKYPLRYININLLEPWDDVNVRKTDKYTDIETLASNIDEIGVQSPLLVKPVGGKFKVISGQRRLLASRRAGLKEVPCIIREDIKPVDAVIASFSENIYRLDMNDDDKADAAYYLLEKLHSVDEVAKKLGVTPTTVRKYLSYKNLPIEIKEYVRDGKMTSTVAREIFYKFQDEPQLAKDVAKAYAESPQDEKPDVYAAIKQSTSSDSVSVVKRRARDIGGAVKYRILLPKPTSEIVKQIAEANNQKEPAVIAQIVENWVDDFKRGKVRL